MEVTCSIIVGALHTTFAEYLTGEQKQLKELYETMKK
jgi:hypothetical protein